ncbi:hypothetical protein AOLI_G00322990 [Acnodon oligacanthus]
MKPTEAPSRGPLSPCVAKINQEGSRPTSPRLSCMEAWNNPPLRTNTHTLYISLSLPVERRTSHTSNAVQHKRMGEEQISHGV